MVWPSCLESCSSTMRPTTSLAFPGANGMIACIVLVGHACAKTVFNAATEIIAHTTPQLAARAWRRMANEILISALPKRAAMRRQHHCENTRRLRAPQCGLMRLRILLARRRTRLLGCNDFLP